MKRVNKRRIKQEAAAFPVPQTKDAAVSAIAEIGRRQRERDRIQSVMNDELARVRQHYEEQAAPHGEAIKVLSKGVHAWCEAHREWLTDNNKVKHARLASGEVKWRLRPPSVSVRGAETVMALLKSLGLGRFIRIKEEVNKEAVLNEPAAVADIPGLSISQKEDFVITPFETDLEEIAQ